MYHSDKDDIEAAQKMVEEVFEIENPKWVPVMPAEPDLKLRPDYAEMVEKGRRMQAGIVNTHRLGVDKFKKDWVEYNESHGTSLSFRDFMVRVPMPLSERASADKIVTIVESEEPMSDSSDDAAAQAQVMEGRAEEEMRGSAEEGEAEEKPKEKSDSERLRGAIYHNFKAYYKVEPTEEQFKQYYHVVMEKLILQVVDKTKQLNGVQ